MRVVSVSPLVPEEGIPHAGGVYYLHHLRALRRLGHDVTVLSFADAANRGAADRLDDGIRVILLDEAEPREGLARTISTTGDRWSRRLFPVRPVPRRRRALRSSTAREALRDADLIEYQWTESAWPVLGRGGSPTARSVVVAHDVLLQSYERFLAAAGDPRMPRALLARWRVRSVQRDEARIYRRADLVLTFSEKDALLVRRVADGAASVAAIRPPLGDAAPSGRRAASAGPPTVLFVGAFDRWVNAEAAAYAMDEILPRVVERSPDVRFVFAGAHPTDEMLARARILPERIVVTGRVASLEPLYDAATAVLVPLRSGAGVKFKTVEAMVRGIPVVSTSIGVEGIVDDGLTVFAVADDAAALADALVRVLAAPEEARRQAEKTRARASDEFSPAAFHRALSAHYRPL